MHLAEEVVSLPTRAEFPPIWTEFPPLLSESPHPKPVYRVTLSNAMQGHILTLQCFILVIHMLYLLALMLVHMVIMTQSNQET